VEGSGVKKYRGKKMIADSKNVAKLTKKFDALGINYCERCSSTIHRLTFAHRFTRQFVKTQDEMETVARICLPCHIAIEGKPDMAEIIDSLIATRDDRIHQGV
jgi:hypothetical protein